MMFKPRIRAEALLLGIAALAVSSTGIGAGPDAIRPRNADGEPSGLVGLGGYIPAEHPLGDGATVKLVSLERASSLRNPVVSTFLVDFAPGGSAMLHRTPSSGYLLLHVLSGALTVSAWQAGVGTYGAGETWAEPTFAYGVAAHNASTREPAEALVVVITEDAR